MKIFAGFLMVVLLAACQDKPAMDNSANEQTAATNEKIASNSAAIANLPCLSQSTMKKSPPIKDKSKIKAMLVKSGKITAEMTTEQADKVVNDFIRAKQNSHNKNCK